MLPDWASPDINNATEQFPERLILLNNISRDTPTALVRQFFGVAGTIEEVEVRKKGRHQEALVLYERDDEANAALGLNEMIIDGQPITVQLYSDVQNGHSESARNHSKYAEYIASGIITAQHLDVKYSLKEKATGVVNTVQDLDQRYGVSNKAERVANYFNLWDRVNTAMTVATSVGNRALETRIGKRVQATYGTVKENVIELALDTQDILEEKQQAASPLDMEPVDGLEQEDEAIDLS